MPTLPLLIPFTARGLARPAPRVAPRAEIEPRALARVRSSVTTNGTGTTINIQFTPTPPAVGNAVIAHYALYNQQAPPATITDNYGNVYTLILHQTNSPTNTIAAAAMYFCAKILASGSAPTFTISLPFGGTQWWTAGATEVSFAGGLELDRVVGAGGANPVVQPTSGLTAPLTASSVFAVAVVSMNGSQGSIAVESVSPPWSQEWEQLSGTNEAGEADVRVLTGVLGVQTSVTWAIPSATQWNVILATFKEAAPAGNARLYPPDRSAGVLATVPSKDFLINASGIVYDHFATDSGGIWEYAQVNPRRGL